MATVDPARCLPLLARDQPATTAKEHCEFCGGPTVDGEYAEPADRTGGEAMRRFMLFCWEHPQQCLALVGRLLGYPQSEIAARMAKLLERRVTRQAVHAHLLSAAARFPDQEAALFDRVHESTDQRKPEPMRCVRCGIAVIGQRRSKKHCDDCAVEARRERERKRRAMRGVHYPT